MTHTELQYQVTSVEMLHDLINSLPSGVIKVVLALPDAQLANIGDTISQLKQLRYPPATIEYSPYVRPPELTIQILPD